MARRKVKTEGGPTIVEVAREAGISPATAGRVLGRYGQVSARSRDLVEDAARRLGYRPNSLARSLIQGSTQTVGVVVTDVGNAFFAQAVKGVSDALREASYEVLLVNSDSDREVEHRAISVLGDKRVDGAIIAGSSPETTGPVADLLERGVHVVLLDRPMPQLTDADLVTVDNLAAARKAVGYLCGLGHRSVGIISEAADELSHVRGSLDQAHELRPSAARLAGYLEALLQADIDPNPTHIKAAKYQQRSAASAAAALLNEHPEVTAVFTTDSVLTAGALQAVQESGRACPQQVSLLGFDDHEWTTLVRPQLSVVSQPSHELGRAASELLLERMRGEAPNGPIVQRLPAQLITRESTGAPPSA